MLGVLILGVLAPAGLGLPTPAQLQPGGSQCVEHDCFALFRGPANFLAASQTCESLGGHLMTVRSSVAADVISLLLSGDSGDGARLWIGLLLPPGCSDPRHLGSLRGFQWVTGDNSTSYSRWAQPDRGSAPFCGPLCVEVSVTGDPAPGEPADAVLQADGRSCAAAASEHSCEDLCQHFCIRNSSDARGSYTCMCETGYQLAADQHHCEDVDDCKLVPNPCPQLCVNTQGGFRCHCYPGYDLVDGECVEPVDPCFGSTCEYQCQPVGQTDYRCICAEGFAPSLQDPHRCRMFCNQTSCPADCDPNTPGSCQCPEGYILDDGFMCTDIDECDNSGCPQECRNLPGSFECICGSDSPFAGQVGPDCDPITVTSDEDDGSGELPTTPLSTSSPTPSRHSGVLIGTSIASLSLVVALLALLCHLRKKQGASRADPEYKCAAPGKEVVLQYVRTERAPQKL
ncbi:thrombomodulin [Tupaia chinensis]|uniref:thrombomodulin n=1 Tax=Tupaia chinensis TaxID=246437 RepID=UPI0003C8C553|nr:thrombomodulin [Tupaia chinensis]